MVRKVTQSDDLHTLRSFRNASSALDSLYGQFAKACGLSVNEYWSLVLIGEGGPYPERDMQKAVSQPSDDQFHIQAVAEEAVGRTDPGSA